MTEAVRKGKTIKSSNRCNVILLLYSIGSFEKQPIGNLFEDFSQFVSIHMSHLFMMAHFVFSQ